MPRIDPLQLLNCLHVLLTPTGGMKSENEVARISSLMEKFSKKLVSKCVYLLILKNSEPALLSRFMTLGGWNLIYHWLIQAIEAKNYPFLIELLEVILVCPVDIDRMKSNPMPRVVKSLSKDLNIDPKARDIASEIVKDWLVIVKSTPSATQPAARPPVTVPPMDPSQRQNEESESACEVHSNEVHRASSENSAGGEEEEDETYTKSTSPSSSSAESDDSDVFVPYQKPQTKKKKLGPKKSKSLVKKSAPVPEEKRQLKSKLITSPGARGEKSGPIKLKIQVSSTESKSSRKSSDEKTIEEKLKEKRKMKDDKEKEKFARFKQEREKKEKRDKNEPDTKSRENKHFDEKLKGELSKLIPKSLEKLGRIPKLNKDKEKEKENGSVSSDKRKDEKKPPIKSDEKKPDRTKEGEKSREKEAVKRDRDGKKVAPVVPPPPPKKPLSISVEKRTAGEVKPKTVKAYNSKFRLTGLEQEVVPKPAARKPGSVSSSSPNSVSAGYEKSAVKRSPTKDVENEPIEKRIKSPEEEKLSPAPHRNKKPFLQESDSFMNAMDIALITQKEQLRKRKKPPPKSESEEKSESPNVTPRRKNSDVSSPIIAKTEPAIKTEPVAEAKPVFKFYKDTLETSIEENTDTIIEAKEEPKEDVDIKAKPEPVDEDDKPKVNLVEATSDPSKPRSAVGLKSSLSLFRTKKLPKKSVTWRADEELEAVQFFEVDATERTNVVRNFWEMQMMERTKERDMMMVRKSGDNDKMAVQTKWKPLIPIDLTPPTTPRGANSQEKNIQYARERIVPPSLYYNKSMVPDTPAEPDLEIHPVTVPPIIPLDDISGTSADSVNDFSNFKWPEPKQFAPDNVDVNAMKGFLPGMPPPIFPPFADGTFPPPFAQPFFPGGAVPPLPVPGNWTATSTDANQPNATPAVPWVPPGVVPPPGMIGPPPFGMMAPFPPMPGAAFPPAMFPMNNAVNNTTESTTTSSGTENQYSNSNYSTNSNNKDSSTGGGGGSGSGGNSNSGSGSKKWTNDDRYYSKKDNWRNNYNDRRSDKRGSGSWRGSGANSRLCRFYQKKGFCSVSGCRFYHPDKN